MTVPEEGCLLRVFVGESTPVDGKPAFEAIVRKARELGLAGATVLRGVMGFGATSRIHAAHLLSLSDDLPVVVEIVDGRERIERILPYIDEVLTDGLVTLERAEVRMYRAAEPEKPA
jgi:PII-like signaling protein